MRQDHPFLSINYTRFMILSTYFVTHNVSLHWLTRVSLSSSLWGRTVISSKVLGRAQNSLLTGSIWRVVQLAKFIRPKGCWKSSSLISKEHCYDWSCFNCFCFVLFLNEISPPINRSILLCTLKRAIGEEKHRQWNTHFHIQYS